MSKKANEMLQMMLITLIVDIIVTKCQEWMIRALRKSIKI